MRCSELYETQALTFCCSGLEVLRLVYELRQAGHFTAVALTRPFEFEGRRKAEAAETLISALEEAAHFVTVIEQVGLPLPQRPHAVCHPLVNLHVATVGIAYGGPANHQKLGGSTLWDACCLICARFLVELNPTRPLQ